MGNEQQDLFIRALLVYTQAPVDYRGQLEPIIKEMKFGVLKDLLQKMLL